MAIEPPLGNKGNTTRNCIQRAPPRAHLGCRFRPAPNTRAKSGLLCGSSRRVETAIDELRRACRTNRPAIDSGRDHTDEETSVEALVARLKRPVAALGIEPFHERNGSTGLTSSLAVFGHGHAFHGARPTWYGRSIPDCSAARPLQGLSLRLLAPRVRGRMTEHSLAGRCT